MTQKNRDDAVGKAVAWLSLGLAGGLALDLCAKQLLGTYPLVQFVFLRSLTGSPCSCSWAALSAAGGSCNAPLALARLRTVLASGSMFGFFFGLAQCRS